jgi:hypothetical protein
MSHLPMGPALEKGSSDQCGDGPDFEGGIYFKKIFLWEKIYFMGRYLRGPEDSTLLVSRSFPTSMLTCSYGESLENCRANIKTFKSDS